MDASHAIVALAGLAAGAAVTWLLLRARLRADAAAAVLAERAGLEARLEERDLQIEALRGEVARREAAAAEAQAARAAEAERRAGLEATLEQERRAAEEKLRLLDDAQAKLGDAFKALSARTLEAQGESFLRLAQVALEKYQESARGDLEKRQQAIGELVAPVRDSLGKLDSKLGAIEKEREGAYRELTQQVRSLGEAQGLLRAEAQNLVKALRTPQVRGRWGEVQLKRVVELAGMLPYCDFVEQETVTTEAGRIRPDLIVRLPGGKSVVVDAKAPLAAYLDAVEARDDATRQAKLAEHARQVRDHVTALSRKSYWDQFQSEAPEFVVMFLPGESFFSAALEQDPGLIEAGAGKNVVIATPTTLIALLKAVAYGWRQEKVAENARAVSELGRELHKRIGDMAGHLARLGEALDKSVAAYNSAVGSIESRVLVSARKLKELEAAGPEVVPSPEPVDREPRRLAAAELLSATDDDEEPVPGRAAAR